MMKPTMPVELRTGGTATRPPVETTEPRVDSLLSSPLTHPSRLSDSGSSSRQAIVSVEAAAALRRGEILTETQPHTTWGGAVTARMYLPLLRETVWTQLTHYPRWLEYFPDMVRSEVLDQRPGETFLYQSAQRRFLLLTVQVEVYLRVRERVRQERSHQLQFQLERGSFSDFSADLLLEDWQDGTLLTYTVRATPLIPVPSPLLQQAMRLDLPANLRQMRNALCTSLVCTGRR